MLQDSQHSVAVNLASKIERQQGHSGTQQANIGNKGISQISLWFLESQMRVRKLIRK